MLRPLALYQAIIAALTPLETILAVCGVIGFMLACISFLAMTWKISWTLRGWVATQQTHAENLGKVVDILGSFVETQKEANQHLQTGITVLSERLNHFDEEREDLHRAVRAVNRKLVYFEGENAKTEQHPA